MIRIKKSLKGAMVKALTVVLVTGMIQTTNVKDTKGANLNISKTSVSIKKGKTKKLTINNTTAKVKWSTSNKYAATVSSKGVVKAKKYGHAKITAKVGGRYFTCKVKIPDTRRQVKISKDEVTIAEGAIYQLEVTSKYAVSYQAKNGDVVSVSNTGLVSGNNPGTTTIYAKSKTGCDTIKVNVIGANSTKSTLESVKKLQTIRAVSNNDKVSYDSIKCAKNQEVKLTVANIDESNVKSCTWTTSNEKVVQQPESDKTTVNTKALTTGTATLTAYIVYNDGTQKVYCNNINVEDPNATKVVVLGPNVGGERERFVELLGVDADTQVKWTNSNNSIASIKSYGTKVSITGKQAGNGTITATYQGKTEKVNYVVENPTFKKNKAVIARKKTSKIKVKGLIDSKVTFASRNKSVAKVSKKGKITGVAPGVTYIDVTIGNVLCKSYRVEIAATGMKTIISKAQYMVDHWKYSQGRRMQYGYYDCSALVWKGYRSYKKYHKKLGSSVYALPAGDLFDYLKKKKKIVYYGFTTKDDLQPGDILFYGDYQNAVRYSTPGRTLNIYHAALYAGNGKVVEKGGQTLNYNGTEFIVGVGRVVKK